MRGALQVWDVVNDEGQPGGVCRFIRHWQGECISVDGLDGGCPRDLLPHRGGRLDRDDLDVEPIAERRGELTGSAPMSTTVIPGAGAGDAVSPRATPRVRRAGPRGTALYALAVCAS